SVPSLLICVICHLLLLLSTHPPPPPSSPLSLHDALPICARSSICSTQPHSSRQHSTAAISRHLFFIPSPPLSMFHEREQRFIGQDRKSTRLNSSHVSISYAVFCLKKKTKYKKCVDDSRMQ